MVITEAIIAKHEVLLHSEKWSYKNIKGTIKAVFFL